MRCDKVPYAEHNNWGRDKKDAIMDKELFWLQNFYLDTVGPLVAFEELSKEEPLTCATIQQALLFLGNASTHLSHVWRMKILHETP